MIDARLMGLSLSSIKTNLPLAKRLEAVPNSALDAVVTHANSDVNEQLGLSHETCYDEYINHVTKNVNCKFSLTDHSSLDIILSQINAQCISGLVDQFTLVRTVLNPTVNEIAQRIHDQEMDIQDKLNSMSKRLAIKVIGIPECLDHGLFTLLKNEYVNGNVQKGPHFKPSFEMLTEDTVMNVLNTYPSDMSETINKLFEHYRDYTGGSLVYDLIYKILKMPNEVMGSLAGSYPNLMLSVVGLLFVKALERQPLPGLNISTDNLKKWCFFAGASLARAGVLSYDLIKLNENNGRLIAKLNKETLEVHVYAEPFNRLKENPDYLDILYGLTLKDDIARSLTIDKITEMADSLIRSGQYHAGLLKSNRETVLTKTIIDSIIRNTLDVIQEARNTEEHALRPYLEDHRSIGEYRYLFNSYIKEQNIQEVVATHSVMKVTADMLCHVLFKDTMAGYISRTYRNIVDANPNYTQPTVIALVLTEILIEWVAQQIIVKSRVE